MTRDASTQLNGEVALWCLAAEGLLISLAAQGGMKSTLTLTSIDLVVATVWVPAIVLANRWKAPAAPIVWFAIHQVALVFLVVSRLVPSELAEPVMRHSDPDQFARHASVALTAAGAMLLTLDLLRILQSKRAPD